MINRVWFTIYWANTAYLLFTLLVLIISFITWKDNPIEVDPFSKTSTQKIIENLNQKLFFDFIDYRTRDCNYSYMSYMTEQYLETLKNNLQECRADRVSSRRNIDINNIYPFLLIMFVFLVRWIVTGKPPNDIDKLDHSVTVE